MKKLFGLILVFASVKLYSQDINVILKQAINYERTLKEDSAILKYQEALQLSPENLQALIKMSLLTTAKGSRQSDKKVQNDNFISANSFAERALALDSNNADANYAKGLALLKMIGTEQENKKVAILVKQVYLIVSKALAYHPNHGKLNFLLGKWNFDLVTSSMVKKATLNLFYGGIPEANIDNAILYMEKCRVAEPYFVINFLELAKAYKFNNNPSKAIEILEQQVKLPNRTVDDAGLKAEGKKILSQMQ